MRNRLAIFALLLAATSVWAADNKDLGSFTKCVTDKQAVMYGAFWCPHCKEQKELFGDSFRNINYVECGVQGDPRGQTPACKTMMIKKYPTWTFSDGERDEKVMSLQDLSQKTGCKLP
jgi:hypothetical protein